jgi:nucleoside-diphosphate-sugar epimerase
MRFLVAGGIGFIGNHLSRALLGRGHSVVCVYDISTGNLANVQDLLENPRYELIRADVAHAPSLPVDVIAHLASPASPVDYDRMPLHTLRANSLGTFRLLEIAGEQRAGLLFVSTSEVYGDPLVHPQPESYWGNVDPIGPRSCYDEGKRFSEALVFASRRETGVRANVVRLFNTYGPGMRRHDGRVIPEMVSAALAGRPLPVHGNGTQTRSFCYVSDLVAGLLHVLEDRELDGEVFNVGNPAEITVRELAERIVELTGRRSDIHYTSARPGDPERRRPVIDKIQARYGWEPRVELREGLRRTIEAFRTADAAEAGTRRPRVDQPVAGVA